MIQFAAQALDLVFLALAVSCFSASAGETAGSVRCTRLETTLLELVVLAEVASEPTPVTASTRRTPELTDCPRRES